MSPFAIDGFGVVDGGLSTVLQQMGHTVAGELWTARLIADEPAALVDAHRQFVESGADVIITASYQASIDGFRRHGVGGADAVDLLRSTTQLARTAVAGTDVAVAASIGPFGAVLGDGSEYHGRYSASWEEVRRFHSERLAVLAPTEPDLFAIETIPSRIEAEIIVSELAALGEPPAWLTFSCRDSLSTCAGDDVATAAAAVAGAVRAVGVNCTAPQHVGSLLRSIRRSTDLPLVAYPNHGGEWNAANECWLGGSPEFDTVLVREWMDAGAQLIGGCCGVGAGAISELRALRDSIRV